MVSVDEAWKRTVLERMAVKGISRSDLARLVGATPGAITVLFKPGTKQSRLVPRIHKVLDLAATQTSAIAVERDDVFRRLLRAWKDLSEDERQKLVEMSELLAVKR